jgi:hypothetical protein
MASRRPGEDIPLQRIKEKKDRLVYYASVIQKLQKEMGFTSGLATFPGLDINPEV